MSETDEFTLTHPDGWGASKKSDYHFARAQEAKNDEFYTRIEDVESEVVHYEPAFEGKIVYCNCDAPWSAFSRHFACSFERLGLRGLLRHAGDFRSDGSIEMLHASDIVVTNPPFSLLRQYVVQLIEYEVGFLILVPLHALGYYDFFNRLSMGLMRVGFTTPSKFEVPTDPPSISEVGCTWITNIPSVTERRRVEPSVDYDPSVHPTYDGTEIIHVPSLSKIPIDFDGQMGVPITYLMQPNMDLFEIVQLRDGHPHPLRAPRIARGLTLEGSEAYRRVIIRRRVEGGPQMEEPTIGRPAVGGLGL